MSEDPHAKRILKAFLRADMPTALIGDGAKLMVASEDASGRSVSGSAEVKDALIEAGADWQDEGVVLSGNLVSSSGAVIHQAMEKFSEFVAKYEGEVIEAA